MKRKQLRGLGVALGVLFACGVSHAGPFYLGGSIGNTSVEIKNAGLDFDANDPGWKVYGGYRFLKFFGAEASYVDLGSPPDSNVTLDSTGIDAFAMGILPLGPGPVELSAKVGLIRWDADLSGFANDTGTDAAYGLGIAFSLKKIAFRLEAEQFDIENTDTVRMISAGVEWRF